MPESYIEKIETNQFKILKKVWKKQIFSKGLLITWVIITGVIALLRCVSYFKYANYIHIQWIPFSSFIFPGVTGLSFSITMLNATRNLFDTEELMAMFTYVDDENKDATEEGDIFYRTLAPYITASILWLLISLIAFISSLINIDMPVIIKELLYIIFIGIVVAGFLNLWYLISVHLKDISIKVGVELDKKGNNQ